MRVLHIIPSLDPATGGPARSVPALCDALHTGGARVSLFAMHAAGAELTVTPEKAAFDLCLFQTPFRARDFPSVTFGRTVYRAAQRVDVVHINSLWNPVVSLAAAACRRVGVPYLISPRGMLQAEALKRRATLKRVYAGLVERRTLAGAAAFHFLTKREEEESRCVPHGKATFVIPSGVDPRPFESIPKNAFRARYPMLQGRPVVLFLGRLHWSKGLDVQAAALAAVVRAIPECAWVVAGPDCGYGGELKARVDALGFRENFVPTGLLSRAEALEALVDADVVVLSSRHEAHSLSLIHI